MHRLLMVLLVALVASGAMAAVTGSVELIQGLNEGQVWAEFRGAGERAVTGEIGRVGDGPTAIEIQGGTQFWAQAGGGIQGQSSIGRVTLDLRQNDTVTVTLRTCCTNINLAAATADDVMLPLPCPDYRLARLLNQPKIAEQPHNAVQAAVWALANNPRPYDLYRVFSRSPEAGDTPQQHVAYTTAMVAAAGGLLRAAGLDPSAFRLFQP